MKNLFLTSCLDTYCVDANGNVKAKNFGNVNQILDNFKKYIKKYDNFVFVASQMADTAKTDGFARLTFDSFKLTLPFKNYIVLDNRNKEKAKEIILNADFIFLCGGYVPSQLELFELLDLKKFIKDSNAVICGVSAGSMNSAETVYCPPELDGEAVDKSFKRYRQGLGLTDINIYPHWKESGINELTIDGLNVFKDIMLPDSKNREFYAFNDGTYILQTNEKTKIYGEAYKFQNGEYSKVCDNNNTITIKQNDKKMN